MSWAREDGTTRCNNVRQVFLYWRMERTSVSLMVRRLRRHQSWARCPEEHGSALAAVFGSPRLDVSRCIQRLTAMSWTGPDSTPWAQQFATDAQTLARAGEGMGWHESRDSDIASFEEG
eukprot:2932284-Pyramimonas_sp.AAC.1